MKQAKTIFALKQLLLYLKLLKIHISTDMRYSLPLFNVMHCITCIF